MIWVRLAFRALALRFRTSMYRLFPGLSYQKRLPNDSTRGWKGTNSENAPILLQSFPGLYFRSVHFKPSALVVHVPAAAPTLMSVR